MYLFLSGALNYCGISGIIIKSTICGITGFFNNCSGTLQSDTLGVSLQFLFFVLGEIVSRMVSRET